MTPAILSLGTWYLWFTALIFKTNTHAEFIQIFEMETMPPSCVESIGVTVKLYANKFS